jgi:hypothetical protein
MATSTAAAWLSHCQSYRHVYGVYCITVVTQCNLICCVRDVWNTVIGFVRVYAVKCNADGFRFGNLEESEWNSHRKFSIRFPSVVSVPSISSTSERLRRSFQRLPQNAISYTLATEPGISLIILTPMKILQRNLNTGTFVVWEMKRNVSVVRVCSVCL